MEGRGSSLPREKEQGKRDKGGEAKGGGAASLRRGVRYLKYVLAWRQWYISPENKDRGAGVAEDDF